MRLAVSDYDGTLKTDNAVSSENIAAVTAWRKAGNLFGIATGRDFSLIMHEIDIWKIPFDFLICVNGAILYDDKVECLKIKNIPDMLIKEVLLHPAALTSMHYQLSSYGVNKLYIRNANSYFSDINLSFKEITFEQSLLEKDVQQISLTYASNDKHLKCADELFAAFYDRLSINLNGLFIDINKHGVNKLSGVLDMVAIQGWSTKGLLAIGDGENDISMIQHFKGFSVKSASRKVVKEATAIYKSVGDMLMDNF